MRLSLVCLLILAIAGPSVVSATDCHRSNCQFIVRPECQNSETVTCSLKRQPNKKIHIRRTSFPEHVQDIDISDVEEMTIGADAVASHASLESIRLTKIGTLTLLPRSMARANNSGRISVTIRGVKNLQLHPETFADWRNSGSDITIREVEVCHMPERTFPASTRVRKLNLAHIASLTIDRDAFGSNSVVEKMLLTEVISLSVKTGAFAPNTTLQSMEFVHIDSLTLHSGVFAPTSSIQKAAVDQVPYLVINSGAIEADIAQLTISGVTMATCEDNTFGSTIQSMSLTSSHIVLTKTGCVSARSGWKSLLIQNSRFDYIEQWAIRGKIEQVQIEASQIGTVEPEGLSLNVTKFWAKTSSMWTLLEKSLAVSADEGIELSRCRINILRKHAFRLLHLSGTGRIIIDNMKVNQPENQSLQFDNGQDFMLKQFELAIPCTCDIENLALELGLPPNTYLGPCGDPEQSQWFSETRCVDNGTTPTLDEFHREHCPDTTTTTTTSGTISTNSGSSSGGGVRHRCGEARHGGDGRSPAHVTRSHGPPGSQPPRTGRVSTWVMVGPITAALLMLIILGVFVIRHHIVPQQKERHRPRSIQTQPSNPRRPTSDTSHLYECLLLIDSTNDSSPPTDAGSPPPLPPRPRAPTFLPLALSQPD